MSRQLGLRLTVMMGVLLGFTSLAAAQPQSGSPAPTDAGEASSVDRSDEVSSAEGWESAKQPVAAADTEALPPTLEETLTGPAKEDYLTGRALFDRGDHVRALVKFQSAHRLSDDPRLLWNMAVCEAKRFRYGRAIALVERYLESGSPFITAQDRERARDFVKAAERVTVALRVEVSEPGATVYLDGEGVGTTPLRREVRVDPGSHQLVVKKEGFENFSEPVVIGSRDHVVRANLSPAVKEGRLVVRAGAEDTIGIDGRYMGTGSWEGMMPVGPHLLHVTAPNRRPYQGEVVVPEGGTRTVTITLEPASAAKGVPKWVWIAGGSAIAAGAVTAGYFLFRPEEEEAGPDGSVATIEFPWR